MNKQSYLYGIIGLLTGLIIGYIGTNYINQTYGPPSRASETSASSNNLPPDHPPTGAAQGPASGGQQADVLTVIEQARNEPANVEAQMKAAELFKQINRHEGALEFYERAYKAKPGDFKLLVALGDTNFDLRRYEEAEKWYLLALKQNPNDATVRMDLGLSFYLRSPRELDKAIAAYRDALKVDPRHEKTLQNLTQALIDRGDKTPAGETLRRLEGVNPANPSISQLRAQLSQ